ncbi:hypothetical protein DL96DRAFT_1575346 [Flagelloscypha sp. PMI_526]|nr:hypothetical protein DL96DRAFT_1575346 [Flagelloscypha sp. PMI_526]
MSAEENPFSDPPSRSKQSNGRSNTSTDRNAPMPANKRGTSQDSANAATGNPPPRPKNKKKSSQHADVIDRLDFTGVGLFHHDGPFDACAPSRNRQRNKAPMFAWSGAPGEEQQLSTTATDPYPTPTAYSGYQESKSRKQVDAIAEAWGVHEPEPYEEFFAGGGARPDGTPASSIYNGKENHTQKEEDTRSRAARNPARRSQLPPPQPIFADAGFEDGAAASQDFSDSAPKRSKSLMQRFKRMRDNPNAPPSPNPRQGRFPNGNSVSPSTEKPDPYVYIEPSSPGKKSLPETPASDEAEDYFDANGSTQPTSTPGSVGRKTSIMKKMGRVVRGTK